MYKLQYSISVVYNSKSRERDAANPEIWESGQIWNTHPGWSRPYDLHIPSILRCNA